MITYEELQKEWEKYRRNRITWTPELDKALLEARDKYAVTWHNVAKVFSEKLGFDIHHRTIADRYYKLKSK